MNQRAKHMRSIICGLPSLHDPVEDLSFDFEDETIPDAVLAAHGVRRFFAEIVDELEDALRDTVKMEGVLRNTVRMKGVR